MKIKLQFAIIFLSVSVCLFLGALIAGAFTPLENIYFPILLFLFGVPFLFFGLKFWKEYTRVRDKKVFLIKHGFKTKSLYWEILEDESIEFDDTEYAKYIQVPFEHLGISFMAKSELMREGLPKPGEEVTILYNPRDPSENYVLSPMEAKKLA